MTQRIASQTQKTRRVIAHTLSDDEALSIAGPASVARHKGHRLQALFIPLDDMPPAPEETDPKEAPPEDDTTPEPVVGAKAPDRVLLFAYGATETTKGTFFLSQESAALCLEAEVAYGNDLLIDKDHASMGWECDTTAYGWWSQEVDEVGIWAGAPRYNSMGCPGIWWLDNGKRLVESYEYRYISPVIWTYFDDQGRDVIVEIINFALTNMPATKNRTPIINHRGGLMAEKPTIPNQTKPENQGDTRILAAVNALTGQTDAEKILGSLEALAELKATHAKAQADLVQLRKEFEVLEKKARGFELDVMVLEKKLAPAMRQKAELWSKEKLAGYLEGTAGQTPAAHVEEDAPVTNSDSPDAPVQLTAKELAHCEKTGIEPELYAANKVSLYRNQKVSESLS